MENKGDILLIGAGQLGSRHLQGLAKSVENFNVHIVDINPNNIEIAKQRFAEIESKGNVNIISTVSSVEQLNTKQFDLAIIATNADIRAEVTKELISRCSVKNIIFEKVAFQSKTQFEEIISKLKTQNIKSWVNCPRRYFDGYKRLAEELKGKRFQITVNGEDWGLACNSVHFIDLFAFLSHSELYKINNVDLLNEVFESKRKGFIEFFGTYHLEGVNGSEAIITCNTRSETTTIKPISIEIYYAGHKIVVQESANKILYFEGESEMPIREEVLGILYQSNLSGIQAEQILNDGFSMLPTIEESYGIHAPFLSMIKVHYERIIGHSVQTLPIT